MIRPEDELQAIAETAALKASQLLREDMEEIVAKAVGETLTRLGIAVDSPLEMQLDMQYLRDWRRSSESIKSKAILVMVGIIVTGVCGALWLGLKELLHR